MGLLVLLAGCRAYEPQIIIHTRVVQATVPCQVSEVTRVVVVTPTPLLPAPIPSQGAVRANLVPPGQNGGLGNGARTASVERLAQWLSEQSGLQVSQVSAAPDHSGVAQALCNGQLDVAWLSTPAYLLANDTCGAQATFTVVRQGLATQRAQILVLSDARRRQRGLPPLRSVGDLDGQAIGFTDPRSVSEYLVPKSVLARSGVTPNTEVFLAGEGQAFLAVYRGEVDAAAGRWWPPQEDGSPTDARSQLVEAYPDIFEATKVLRLSAAIPNDPIVFRRGLAEDLRAPLVAALADLVQTRDGRQLLVDLSRASALMPVSDADYDIVREALSVLQMSPEQFLD